MILYLKETVIRVIQKLFCKEQHTLFEIYFFKGPQYTRNIVFFMIRLQIFRNIKKVILFLKMNNFKKLRIKVVSFSCRYLLGHLRKQI